MDSRKLAEIALYCNIYLSEFLYEGASGFHLYFWNPDFDRETLIYLLEKVHLQEDSK
jgi:hypothetical protein